MSIRRIAVAACAVALAVLLAEGASGPPAKGPDLAEERLRIAFLGRIFRGGGCVNPDAVRDQDVRRNLLAIKDAGLCVSQDKLSENGIDWRFTSIANTKSPRGPVWYLPHDDEQSAFDAAVYAVARYGGRLVAVDGGEGRNYRGVDPNRTFALTLAEARPCAIRNPAPRYSEFVMDLFGNSRHIFSMHNNTRGGSISIGVDTAKTKGFRASGQFSDPDHMVYIAGTKPLEADGRARATRDKLMRAGLSVVYEEVSAQNNDCSFSNHVALHDNREYFNVEAVHGSNLQKGMVDALMSVLGYRAVS